MYDGKRRNITVSCIRNEGSHLKFKATEVTVEEDRILCETLYDEYHQTLVINSENFDYIQIANRNVGDLEKESEDMSEDMSGV